MTLFLISLSIIVVCYNNYGDEENANKQEITKLY